MNTDKYCPCLADKAHSSKTTTSSTSAFSTNGFSTSNQNNPSSFNSNNNNFQQFASSGSFGGQTHFGSIVNSMALLQQIPVVPQVPGYPSFYAPDQIPKGAIVAFMPVIILPEAAYASCKESSNQFTNEHIQNPLGVQPASIPFGFSLNSLFPEGAKKDQCMCPCSCTQNIPNHLHTKREVENINEPASTLSVTDSTANKLHDGDEKNQSNQSQDNQTEKTTTIEHENPAIKIDDVKNV